VRGWPASGQGRSQTVGEGRATREGQMAHSCHSRVVLSLSLSLAAGRLMLDQGVITIKF
jgi:hypothetical protein